MSGFHLTRFTNRLFWSQLTTMNSRLNRILVSSFPPQTLQKITVYDDLEFTKGIEDHIDENVQGALSC